MSAIEYFPVRSLVNDHSGDNENAAALGQMDGVAVRAIFNLSDDEHGDEANHMTNATDSDESGCDVVPTVSAEVAIVVVGHSSGEGSEDGEVKSFNQSDEIEDLQRRDSHIPSSDNDGDTIADDNDDYIAVAKLSPVSTPSQQYTSKGSAGRYFAPKDITVKCFHCDQVGHMRADCTEERKKAPCFLCGLFTHQASRCKSEQPALSKFVFCWLCCKDKHDFTRCPARRKWSPSQNRLHCYVCGQQGHINCSHTSVRTRPRPGCANCASGSHALADCPRPTVTQMTDRVDLLGYQIHVSKCFTCGSSAHKSFECTKSGKSSGTSRRSSKSRRRSEIELSDSSRTRNVSSSHRHSSSKKRKSTSRKSSADSKSVRKRRRETR